MNLNLEAARVHAANAKWWCDLKTGAPIKRNVGELMMLVVSELSEALEGHRKDLMDDKLPHRKMFEVELADAVIRLLDTANGFGCKLEEVSSDDIITYDNVGESLLQISRSCWSAYYDHSSGLLFGRIISLCIAKIQKLSDQQHCDLWAAYEEKMAYNAVRADHKVENRLLAGGKKY